MMLMKPGRMVKAVFIAMNVASIGQSDAPVLGFDTPTHDHSDGSHSHAQSPLESKLKQAVADQTGYEINGHEASEGPNLKASSDEHTQETFKSQSCPVSSRFLGPKLAK